MNFNFKNLSENTKRIRIIPKNDTELFANIGVDNPTAMIDEGGVFSVCLSPYEIPEYGDWVLNQGYEIVGNDIKYTAYKTNGLNYYDSFALADLVQTLVKSFHDLDLQQYAAFTTAVEQLIGSVDWVLDPENNQIIYKVPTSDLDFPHSQYIWTATYGDITKSSTAFGAASLMVQETCIRNNYYSCGTPYDLVPTLNGDQVNFKYDTFTSSGTKTVRQNTAYRKINPAYDPTAEQEERSIPLETVAEKVISNAESSEDEVLMLLSEDYINLVAESIFNNDTSKQFIELEGLIPQLEANKVLRS